MSLDSHPSPLPHVFFFVPAAKDSRGILSIISDKLERCRHCANQKNSRKLTMRACSFFLPFSVGPPCHCKNKPSFSCWYRLQSLLGRWVAQSSSDELNGATQSHQGANRTEMIMAGHRNLRKELTGPPFRRALLLYSDHSRAELNSPTVTVALYPGGKFNQPL